MENRPGAPYYIRTTGPDVFAPEKPSFLTALTLILELSFYHRQNVYLIAETMHRWHAAYRIFTPQLIAMLIGHEGPGVVPPYTSARTMVEYAVGVFKIILDLHDNFCTVLAIEQKLVDDGFHKVPRQMITTIEFWYDRYQEL